MRWGALVVVLTLVGAGCAAGDDGRSTAARPTDPGPAASQFEQVPSTTGAPATTDPLYAVPVDTVTVPPLPTLPPSPPPVTTPAPTTVPVAPPRPCPAANGPAQAGGQPVVLRAPALAARAPLVIVLPDDGQTPEDAERATAMTTLATRVGAIAAYPAAGSREPAALAAVIGQLVAERCADGGRVLLAGFGAGGRAVVRAVCDPSVNPLVRAAGPVAAPVAATDTAACAADGLAPVPMLAINGGLDPQVPLAGGASSLAPEAWVADVGQQLNGCGPPPMTPVDAGGGVTIMTAVGCPVNTALVVVGDEVHRWPGAPTSPGGPPVGSYLASEALWALLSANAAANG